MSRNLLLLTILAACLGSFAQEPLMPLLPEKDSSMMAAERQIMYHQLLSGVLPAGILEGPSHLPEFDFQSEMIKRWKPGISPNIFNYWSFGSWLPGSAGLAVSPFLRDETVFSGSAFHLNDRFSFGGYSFSAKSPFSAPFPNQGFDVRGASLFMQYNVSKKVKIETRVNVTQGPGF